MIATAARLALSLAVVLGLMALAARYLRQRQGGGRLLRSAGAAVQVVTRHSLTRNASVAVVRVEGALLLLGVTDQSVQVLRELDQSEESEEPATEPGRLAAVPDLPRAGSSEQWKTFVNLLRERTVRRG